MSPKRPKRRKKVQVHLYRRLPGGRVVFLLLQRAPQKESVWQSVTGNVEPGESPEDAAPREVAEETGLALTGRGVGEVWRYDFTSRKGDFEEHVSGFEATDEHVNLSHEHQAFQWIELDKALELIHYDGIKEGLKRVAAALANESARND